jgi:large repetitive protein
MSARCSTTGKHWWVAVCQCEIVFFESVTRQGLEESGKVRFSEFQTGLQPGLFGGEGQMLRINHLAVMCLGLMFACGPNEPGEGGPGFEALPGQVRAAVTIAGTVSVSPTSLAFGGQTRDTTSGNKAVTITNGTSKDVTCTITAPLPFYLVNPANGALVDSLTMDVAKNGGTRTRNVVFRPTIVGSFGGEGAAALSLSITCGNNLSVSLTGTGVSSAASAPVLLTFGPQKVGTSSQHQQVVVSNISTAFNITSITVPAGFAVAPLPTEGAPVQVPGGTAAAPSTTALSVVFSPTVLETPTGTLSITTSEPSTLNISLSGTVVEHATHVRPSPPLTVFPLDFGDQRVGVESASQGVMVHNAGETDLNITDISITGPFRFTYAAPQRTLLRRGESQELLVTFTPNDRGEVPGELDITTDEPDPNNPTQNVSIYVGLVGRGVEPELELSRDALAFGDRRVGATPIPTETVTVTNRGTGPLELTGVPIVQTAPGGASAFTLVSSSRTIPGTLGAGESLVLTVGFNPSAEVEYTGTLTLATTDHEVGNVPIPLTGRGVRPHLMLEPHPELDFGDVRVGFEVSREVRVRNTGSMAITINTVEVLGDAAFTLGSPNESFFLPAVIGERVLTVRFKPTAVTSSLTGTLRLTSGDPEFASVNHPLRGRGVEPKLVLEPLSGLAFGETRVGTEPTMTVTVTNSGSGPINFTEIFIEGDQAFTLVSLPSLPFLLQPGSMTLTVRFRPLVEMPTATTATLKLRSDDPDPELRENQVGLSGRGVRPNLELSTRSLSFGSQVVGTESAPQPVTLRNTGSGTLRITSIRVSEQYKLDSTQSFDLTDTNRERTLSVTFAPTRQGPADGTVTFTTNDPNNAEVTIVLSGNGEVSLSVSRTEINFGDVRVGDMAEQEVIFTNTGSVTITLSKVLFLSERFSHAGIAFPVELRPGQPTAALKVRFTPTRTGEVSGALVVESSANNSPHTVSLLGKGTEAKAQITFPQHPGQTALDFGDVEVGITAQEVVRLTNVGDSPLQLTGAHVLNKLPDGSTVISNSPFEYRGPSTREIAPNGGFIEFPVAFTPTESANASATLVINSNAVNSVVGVPLLGNGVTARIEVSPAALNFGNQHVGRASPPQQVFITNTGRATLKIQGFSFTSNNTSNNYAVTSPSPLPSPSSPLEVPSQQRRAIEVTFTPTSTGSIPGSLTILSNAVNPLSPLPLSGTGVDGNLVVFNDQNIEINEIAFGAVDVGAASERRRVRLRNTGDFPLTLLNASIHDPSGENPFLITGFSRGLVLQTGNVHDFSVTFVPTMNGYQGAILVIESDSGLNPIRNVSLSGTGMGAEVELLRSNINFGRANVGTSTVQSMSIRNKGVSTLEVYDISYANKGVPDGGTTGGNDDMALDFSVARSADGGSIFPLRLDAGALTSVDLRFSPTAVGLRVAEGVVYSNAKAARFDVSGEGTSPILTVEPTSLTIDGVMVGTYSAPYTITITNEGNGTVFLQNIVLSGSGFSLTHSTLPIPLEPKRSEVMVVTFRPTEEMMTSNAQLLVEPSSSSVPRIMIPIWGVGVRQPISVESEVDFGQQLMNNTSLPRTLNVSNNTETAIMLTDARVIGTDASRFTLKPLVPPIAVNRGTPLPLEVSFSPRTEEEVNAVLRLWFTGMAPIDVNLRGKGIPKVLSINPSPLDFGSVRAGTSSRREPITLLNLSSDPITLSLPEETYTTGEPFIFDPPLDSFEGLQLQPGVPVIRMVSYQPAVETMSETTVFFGTTVPPTPRAVEFRMRGRATRRILNADVQVVDFGRVDTSRAQPTRTITIFNKSFQPQRVEVGLKMGEDSPFSLETSGLKDGIPPEGSAIITVTFDPDQVGAVEDEVQLRLQGHSDIELEVALKGIGRVLLASGGGCGCGSTDAGSAGLMALLTLMGLRSLRRRRER